MISDHNSGALLQLCIPMASGPESFTPALGFLGASVLTALQCLLTQVMTKDLCGPGSSSAQHLVPGSHPQMGRCFSNICTRDYIVFVYCNKQNSKSKALPEALAAAGIAHPRQEKVFQDIHITNIIPFPPRMWEGPVDVGGIFSHCLNPFSIWIQFGYPSNHLDYYFCNHLKFVHGLSKSSHMCVKQAPTPSSDFSESSHLAIMGTVCEY